MTKPVEEQLIFHITHVDNLPAILADGCLWSDAEVLKRPNKRTVIGFDTIKKRRLQELPVKCHSKTLVGQYVPFYFCPRSPMLYVIHKRSPELSYNGGQDRIIHLVSCVGMAIDAAEKRPWAFTDGNAGATYTSFSNDLTKFDDFVDKNAIRAHYWSDPAIKERKQAEFLVHHSFPWTSFFGIGVLSDKVAKEVQQHLSTQGHRPEVVVKPEWYY